MSRYRTTAHVHTIAEICALVFGAEQFLEINTALSVFNVAIGGVVLVYSIQTALRSIRVGHLIGHVRATLTAAQTGRQQDFASHSRPTLLMTVIRPRVDGQKRGKYWVIRH